MESSLTSPTAVRICREFFTSALGVTWPQGVATAPTTPHEGPPVGASNTVDFLITAASALELFLQQASIHVIDWPALEFSPRCLYQG